MKDIADGIVESGLVPPRLVLHIPTSVIMSHKLKTANSV